MSLARVLQLREPVDDIALVDPVAPVEVQHHLQVRLRVAEPVDGRHRGDDDGVPALEQCLGGRQAHLLDVRVDGGVLFYIGIRSRHIGFRLVVVVIGNEVFHRVVREELAELAVELGGQGLVRRQHQGRPLHGLNDVGDGEGLARPGYAEQSLMAQARAEPVHPARRWPTAGRRRGDSRQRPRIPLAPAPPASLSRQYPTANHRTHSLSVH